MQEFYFAMDKRADEEESPAHAWLKFGAAHMNESRKKSIGRRDKDWAIWPQWQQVCLGE